ncbi:MAG TPA: hypothetical protein VG099_24660 [Gemmataceae bacterium]|jgi:hypothetical protein|nr:hypothetical protein [Gemmataceae bacterium]
MSLFQIDVGAARWPDNAQPVCRGGNQGELITHEMSGKHFEQTLRGKMNIYTTPAQALLLSATTGLVPTVVNPYGSGVLFVPLSIQASFVSGTTTIGSVLLAETLQCGSQIGTASPIPTGTFVAAKNGNRGAAYQSSLLWAPTTITFTAAPTVVAATGLNMSAGALGMVNYEVKLDGSLVYPPGTAMSLVYSVTTSTALYFWTIKGLEIPLPLTA